jgi:PadR family transcriptional regulator, regulatory protein PadR
MVGRLEETILCAIVGLGGESYSSDIQQYIGEHIGRDISPGSLLTTLYRMQEKGFVSSRYADPLPQRGGRRRRMFRIEGTGQKALREAELLVNLRNPKLAPT